MEERDQVCVCASARVLCVVCVIVWMCACVRACAREEVGVCRCLCVII